jgi:PTS system nitrogen regulatory IIA component
MMTLQDILTPECTLSLTTETSKKKVLEKICAIASAKYSNISQHELLDSLLVREKMGSTGIGNGIAIPHGRLANTTQVIAVLLTTQQAIAFDAIDNRSVDIFIALFVPEDCCKDHLTTLQSIAELFNNKKTCKQARKCQTSSELYALVNQTKENK